MLILAGLSLFCLMQAIYWQIAWRRARKGQLISSRLGQLEVEQAGGLERDQDEGWVQQLSFSQGLRDVLDQAGEDTSIGAFLGRSLAWFLGGFAILVLVTNNLFGALMMALAVGAVPWLGLTRKRRKRMDRIEEQLPEALEIMTISLRAGHSLAQTIKLSSEELQAPIADEFRRVAEEQSLGRPIDEALLAMSQRLNGVRTVRTFVVSVMVLRQTGGNLIEVLESIIDTMRQQAQYARKLSAMTAEGRSSARTLSLLPPGFTMMAYLADPGYIGRLITDSLGQMLLLLAFILWILGVVWVRRLVKPQV